MNCGLKANPGILVTFFFFVLVFGLPVNAQKITVVVSNTLNFERSEIVAVSIKELHSLTKNNPIEAIRVTKQVGGDHQTTQWMDADQDGVPESILFQAIVPANGKTRYEIQIDPQGIVPDLPQKTFSRFVPERSDDYAWENDKVAFRVYGPKGQKEALEGVAGSTLSSGIDLWLKKVAYPIINKWYENHVKTPGYYHVDHGEGYDPYHVGNGRGTGGIGILQNDSLRVSNNFVSYKTIAVGPLRTIFELTYAPWSEFQVRETKRISLDLGSNFSKFEIFLTSEKPVPNYSIGIQLHKNKGLLFQHKEQGIYNHWESIDGAFVGESVIVNPKHLTEAFSQKQTNSDDDNFLIVMKATQRLDYYAGFSWSKSGQINNQEDWETITKQKALSNATPLRLKISKN